MPDSWGPGVGGSRCEKYCIVLFHLSGHLEQFGGVFFGGKINYFGGKGTTFPFFPKGDQRSFLFII